MRTIHEHLEPSREEFLAELTAAAYRVALRHGLRGPFIDVELDLWHELRAVFGRERFSGPEPDTVREEAIACRS